MSGSVTQNVAPQTLGFSALVANQAAVVQSSAATAIDLSTGSVLRAVLEATAGAVGLWLQALILAVAARVRLATSTGSDVDSFIADFGLTRIPAVAARGSVVMARFTPTYAAVVPVGVNVTTSDGSQTYSVIADATQPAWSATAGAYVIAAGVASITVTVQAQTAGAAGNAAAGFVSLLASAVAGIDTVSNITALTGGADAEADAAVRLRFQAFIASLPRSTKAAIGYAITSVQAGLLYNFIENYDVSGNWAPGSFLVVVDDGTGYPSSALLAQVGTSIDLYRGATVRFSVQAPVVVSVSVSALLTVASGYSRPALVAAAAAAITAAINAGGIGAALSYAHLDQVVLNASPGITNVALLVNGATADIACSTVQVIRAGAVTVA